MKRRTYRTIRAEQQPEHHHNVYVVLLDPAVGRLRAVRAANPKRDPKKPCVYVGMTGLTPEERFANHKGWHQRGLSGQTLGPPPLTGTLRASEPYAVRGS